MKKESKQFMSYVIVGILTTTVNYLTYYILLKCQTSWMYANSIAWLLAVLFAYFCNKLFVFKSQGHMKDEFISFFTLRLMTLIVENISLYILIELFNSHQLLSKIIVSFITIISNYILCKFKIFKEEGVIHG
ncbi:MAG: GtrA family protein [Faecalibacillus sp.]